jgi:hypothetical protein
MSGLDALRAGGYEFTPEWSGDDGIFRPKTSWLVAGGCDR